MTQRLKHTCMALGVLSSDTAREENTDTFVTNMHATVCELQYDTSDGAEGDGRLTVSVALSLLYGEGVVLIAALDP